MTEPVDSSFYSLSTYCGKGDNRRIEITNKGLEVVCRVAFNGKFKPLSGNAVRMLLESVDESRFASHTKGFSSDVVNELTTPWKMVSDGAALYPEDHQQWECDDEVFFVQDNPKMLAGNWIASTHYADIAASLICQEIQRLKDRIRGFHQLPASVM